MRPCFQRAQLEERVCAQKCSSSEKTEPPQTAREQGLRVIDWGCSKGPEKCLCEREGGGGFFLWPGLVFV